MRRTTFISLTPILLQEKFIHQSGAGLLSYSGLDAFFGGLEGIIGSPSPNLHEGMCREHTQGPDSGQEFETFNYGVRTTSSTEWKFVAEPDKFVAERNWPTETKLASAPEKMRKPVEMNELERRVAERGLLLEGRKELPIKLEEAIAARL